ncbi:MAG: S41 family peptidase [Mollicutes bacterium]|nr:S41 family peptidase [Mollicutes bacterium]
MEDKEKVVVENKFGTLEVTVLICLTCFISIMSGMFLGHKATQKVYEANQLSDELNEIISNYNYIIENYYGEIDKDEIIKGAIKGMVESLGDQYTSFIEDLDNENFNIQLQGSFTGIGVEIANSEQGIMVARVFENSPAEKADIQPGDIILKIDEIDLHDKSTTELINIIKGKYGEFELIIKRNDEEITKVLQKDTVVIKSVFSKTFEENNKKIGYLKVTLFASNTDEQFKKELTKLENQKIDGLIIDVRWNSGGHLSTVKNMVSEFLDSSHVIYQTESKDGVEKTYSSGTVTKTYPIVVLANEESASASELLIGALRDELGSKIVGTQTFGKGTVQELNTLSSTEQYKITTKKWLTPKGQSIDKVGIKPDFEIELTAEYYETFEDSKDTQLQKALSLFLET